MLTAEQEPGSFGPFGKGDWVMLFGVFWNMFE